ncbi:hypothetical protein E4U21_000911 [Claviceps maximensis]|nr:hypothetical protein E4U21_000911 [Claviceps maximensis]
MQSATDNSLYALQDVPGKGKGLVAIKNIPKGTRILSEQALIAITQGSHDATQLQELIFQKVEALRADQRLAFLSLHNIHPFSNAAEQYAGIMRTNALPAEEIGYTPAEEVGDKTGIFLEACRINHACDNNSQRNWNGEIQRHTVHALRDIHAGEEITITYISPLKNRETRQNVLRQTFDFTCSCRLCSLPEEQSRKSDRRLENIQHLDSKIHQFGAEGLLVSALLTYFDVQIRLYKEQGREDVGIAQALDYAARLAVANADPVRGRIFAQRAMSAWNIAIGSDSTQALRNEYLATYPRSSSLYGQSVRWEVIVEKEPQGLGPDDFEDWLWKRIKVPQRS